MGRDARRLRRLRADWIPAYAGMTTKGGEVPAFAGMTVKEDASAPTRFRPTPE